MAATNILMELSNHNVKLWVNGTQLQYRAPKGAITPALRSLMLEYKAQLIHLLQEKQQPPQLTIQANPDQRYHPFPLSDMQQAYWLGQSNLFELGNVAAHLYAEFELDNLDIDRINQVCQRMIERHEMLRAIVLPDGQQQILPETPFFNVCTIDLRERSPQDAVDTLAATRQRMVDQGPATDHFPLFEVLVHRLDERRYRLYISLSLLVIDGGSLKLLAQEIPLLYQNPDVVLPPLELSYRDYILTFNSLQQSDAYRRSQAYWWNRLETLPPAPDLPLAKNPATLSYPQFQRHTFQLAPEVWQRLKQRAIEAALTPAGVVCAAYTEILAAWSKTSHFTLNVLFSNRVDLHPQVRKVMGNFSSTNLLEVNHTGLSSFVTRAKHLQAQLWKDFEHSHVGGVQVLRELNRVRGGTSRASIPVVFASSLDARDQQGTSIAAAVPTALYSCIQTPQVWLDHSIHESNGALVLHWDVVEALFPAGMVNDMLSAYKQLLTRLANDASAWDDPALQLLPASQLEQRAAVNATAVPIPDGMLHTLMAQVQQRPNHPAIISSQQTLTYAELDNLANRVAHWLQQFGARPNVLIAVVMEKGWEQVVAALGILRSGAAYLPINPALPKERLWYLLEQSEVGLVLTQSKLDATLEWSKSVRRLCVDDRKALAVLSDSPLDSVQTPEDLAYVIFTSGSTGLPKGVMIDHRGAVNTICDLNQRFRVTADDRVLALSSLSFDLSVYDIFGTLAAGATLVMPDAASTTDPAHWTELLLREKVTIWNSVPALMQMLVEYVASQPQPVPLVLRLVMLSGDWLPLTLPNQIKERIPQAEVVSLGGATEASIWSIMYPVQAVDPDWKSIPYGFPMLNQSFQVLNAAFKPCPVWVPGELYIGGIGLAKGYWRDEEKTNARFILHPHTGERLYHTGDLGRYLPDGSIEFLGREDFQVKVQGYRIELGEIETALEQYPSVKSAVVSPVGDRQQHKRLVAYLCPLHPVPHQSENRYISSENLRDFLSQKLPDYMLPSQFVWLNALPLTPNGKVDRKALPAPNSNQPEREVAVIAPRTSLEMQLVHIWQDLFQTDLISITDNFFNLGGHSLLAVRLVAQVQKQLGLSLSLSTLLQEPTIEHVARVLTQKPATSQSPLVQIQVGTRKRPFFCVHPVGGNVLCYADLARSLGTEQSFYGLQAMGADGVGDPLTSVEEMATRYIESIQTVQPHGSYLLGGWSMGGVIAFEMARQLQQQGQRVDLLVLIDSQIPTTTNQDDASLLLWFVKDLGGRSGQHLTIAPVELSQLSPEQRLSVILEQAKHTTIVPADVTLPQFTRLFQVFKANALALSRYQPQPYSGQVILFHPTGEDESETVDQPDVESHLTLGWETFATESVAVHRTPGNHYTMLVQPNLQVLAQQFRKYLDRIS